jgi:hypothetical protein
MWKGIAGKTATYREYSSTHNNPGLHHDKVPDYYEAYIMAAYKRISVKHTFIIYSLILTAVTATLILT